MIKFFERLSQAMNSWRKFAAIAVGLLTVVCPVVAAPTVTTLGGGFTQFNPNFYGYADGNTLQQAQFHTPSGIALDGSYLLVADRDNNAIRILDLGAGNTLTFAIPDNETNSLNKPIGVALDNLGNLFVLNYGNGNNGNVVEFDEFGDLLATNIAGLTNAGGVALDNVGNIYVTASNILFRIVGTNVTAIATITNTGTSLQGIVVKQNGRIAACDSGNNGIWLIDPTATNSYTALAGFHGAGDFNPTGTDAASPAQAKFYHPMGIAEIGDGSLIVSDYGNNRVKVVLSSGVVTNLYGVTSNDWVLGSPPVYPGWYDGTVIYPDEPGDVEARLPNGVALAQDGTVYVTEDYYHIIRHVSNTGFTPPPPPPPPVPAAPTILTVTTNYGQVTLTWTASSGATNYNVKRSTTSGAENTIASTASTSYTDTNVFNGVTYYYVISAVNAGGQSPNSSEVSATPPLPPVPDPQIGWVSFPPPDDLSMFNAGSSFIFNNDVVIAIEHTSDSEAFFTYGATFSDIPAPSPTNGYNVPDYPGDGSQSVPDLLGLLPRYPDMTIKAIATKNDGSPPSQIISTRFQFVTANPVIVGNNAASFIVTNLTVGAQMWYTTDGSDPTNDGSDGIGPISSGQIISLNSSTNIIFKVRAFRDSYQPSSIITTIFNVTNFVPNSISFGFASGEASSSFVSTAGHYFFAPVALNVLPNQLIYSLQFNLTATNLPPNLNTNQNKNTTPLVPNANYIGFESMLKKPDPAHQGFYLTIPPAMFLGYATNTTVVTNYVVDTNSIPYVTNITYTTNFIPYLPDPPPTNSAFYYGGEPFVDLEFTNYSVNLLGIGWLERAGETNLYNTMSQDLIQYSAVHDTLFLQSQGQVLLGAFKFIVPAGAVAGNQYQIQIGRPSATSDGIGRPGSSVYINTPTNSAASISAVKNVTVVNGLGYIAGDCAPFHWLNAGDFGDTNINNSDVEQVFQSAIYNLNNPPVGSDFFDSMDSCGFLGVTNNGKGYYTRNSLLNTNQEDALFNGNDQTINQIAFGDGVLDVCDVYVTFRRALDPTLWWFRRVYTNGIQVAIPVPNVVPQGQVVKSNVKSMTQTYSTISSTNDPQVNFTAGGTNVFQGSAGQTLQIPITANIFGAYPLRVLMLNLDVAPLDGSPALTTPVQFTPNPALGQPTIGSQADNGDYAAAWLNSAISGLTGNATLGTLTVTLPANATSMSAYAIHFDHASASPNGLASFPKQTLTGLITLSDRSSSSYNDGIPDWWRLRYFGSINNFLSVSNADADGDGMNNWQEYVAGTDPTDPDSNLYLTPLQNQNRSIYWPSVAGKQYIIQRSMTLFPASWTSVSTNSGTGTTMEFDDATDGNTYFYRVQVQ